MIIIIIPGRCASWPGHQEAVAGVCWSVAAASKWQWVESVAAVCCCFRRLAKNIIAPAHWSAGAHSLSHTHRRRSETQFSCLHSFAYGLFSCARQNRAQKVGARQGIAMAARWRRSSEAPAGRAHALVSARWNTKLA